MEFIDHDKLKFLKDDWQNEIHIISSGPSLRDFDFNNIKSKKIMTLNNSIYHMPKFITPTYHIYCEPVDKEIKNYINMSSNQKTKCFSIYKCPGWIQISPFKDCNNFAFEIAIKIAEYMGYKFVYLYGYDFSFDNDYMYWWDKEKRNIDELTKKFNILNNQKLIFNKFMEKINKSTKIKVMIIKKIGIQNE